MLRKQEDKTCVITGNKEEQRDLEDQKRREEREKG